MPLTFGTRKADAGNTDFNSNYLRNFKAGETKVRFLEEPDEWILYQEHYTRDRKSFPCTGDTSSCPGCTSDDDQVARRSRKYGTYVLLVDPNYVLPFKLSVSLANRMTARAERNGGTVTNRDYIVIRSGEGLKTEYDVDQDEKYSVDLGEQLKKAEGTIQQILAEQFQENWGDPEQYAPKEKDYKDPRPKTVDKSVDAKPEEAEDKPPFDQDEVTEEQLRSMKRSELKAVWKAADLPADELDDDWDNNEIVDQLIKRVS